MTLLKSLLFGYKGSYNIFDTRVRFENEIPRHLNFPIKNKASDKTNVVSKLVSNLLKSNTFHWITQSHLHIFAHEMGHAIACKVLTGLKSEITIIYQKGGITQPPPEIVDSPDWKQTIICVAGPMADGVVSTCKLVAATAFKSYLPWPITLVLGSSAVISMSAEILFAYASAYRKDCGDFGQIAKYGNTHLTLAGTVLIAQYALGVFLAIKLAA